MNETVNKALLLCNKFMPDMHLKQPGFTYSACGPFTRNKERIRKFMQTGNTDFIRKKDFASLFSIHNTIALSRHEQVYFSGLSFERYLSHHRAT